MTSSSPPSLPIVPPVEPRNIPELLRREKRWIGWWAGPIKASGKFDKYPVDPRTGHKIDPLDPANWLSFDDAMDAYRRDMAKGVGIVLSDQHPIIAEGTRLYLTAIDLDQCMQHQVEQGLWDELGRPYLEVSPSLRGLRMFGLCCTPLRGGLADKGRELYSSNRFMTVTGVGARGTLRDISAGLIALEQRWFPARTAPSQGLPAQPLFATRPETKENIALVISMLQHVPSSKTTYEVWRDIIWAIASTGWAVAPRLAHHWSALDTARYETAAVDKLLRTFDPSRRITLGTLDHHARLNGWTGSLTQRTAPMPPTSPLPPPPPGQAPPLGPLLTAAELRQLPVTPYAVRNVFPAQGLAAIYGEPGSGKSFLALDLAHAIAAGAADWFGFRVRQMPVVYVALEGIGGIGKRITALELHSKRLCPNQLRFWCRDIHLLTGEGTDLLASEIVGAVGTGAIVIVDTLNQAAPGADENAPQDMGKIIANSKRLAASVGGLVILVHHAGKTTGKGLRGHSSLLAAMDTVLEVAKTPAGHKKWCITKAKDDSSDVERDFDLVAYAVGQDDCGPVFSCAVQQTVHALQVRQKAPAGKHQKAALAALRNHLHGAGTGIDYKAALTLVAASLNAPKGKESERAKEAVDALLRHGYLLLNELGVSLA